MALIELPLFKFPWQGNRTGSVVRNHDISLAGSTVLHQAMDYDDVSSEVVDRTPKLKPRRITSVDEDLQIQHRYVAAGAARADV